MQGTGNLDIFISYKREERETARRLAEILGAAGYDVWWDIELLPGEAYSDSIKAVIEKAATTIVLWSRLATESIFVRAEARAALSLNKLLTVKLHPDATPPLPFGELHTHDLSDWDGTATHPSLVALFEAVAAKVKKAPMVALSQVEHQPLDAFAARSAEHAAEAEFWRSIASSRNPAEYKRYLDRFGAKGSFSDLARLRLAESKGKRRGRTILVSALVFLFVAILGAATTALLAPERIPLVGPAIAQQLLPLRVSLGLAEDPNVFTYYPPGDLVEGSGDGYRLDTVFAEDIAFPVTGAPAFLNSQLWSPGGGAVKGDECDPVNFAYPWRDNFCETRSAGSPLPWCPKERGHAGVDVRVGTAEDCQQIRRLPSTLRSLHKIVAVANGTITTVGSYSLTLEAGQFRYRYLHINMADLSVKTGDVVKKGQPLGFVSNEFSGTPTTVHLHFEIQKKFADKWTHVPPYLSLVKAYERDRGLRARQLEAQTQPGPAPATP